MNGSIETSWAAQRVINGTTVWICDAKISDNEKTDFIGFLASLPVDVSSKFKLTANAIWPGIGKAFRGMFRFGRWRGKGGWDEIRTGNKEFDQHYVVHTSDSALANKILSFLLLRRILEQQVELRRLLEVNDVDISFAVLRGQLLIAVNSSRQLIPSKFDYQLEKRTILMIHESFRAVEHLIDNFIVPLQEELAKLYSARPQAETLQSKDH